MPERLWILLLARATSYLGNDSNDFALADVNEAIGRNPDQSALYLVRMRANQRLGNHDAVGSDMATVEARGEMSVTWQAMQILGHAKNAPLTQ